MEFYCYTKVPGSATPLVCSYFPRQHARTHDLRKFFAQRGRRRGHNMTTNKSNNKAAKKQSTLKIIIGVAALAVVIAVMAMLYAKFSEKPVEGTKQITIEVIGKEKNSTTDELKTDAEYLRQAMEEAEGLTFEGDESEYGLMVNTVNGETADYSTDGSYWSFYVNGEYCNYGIDTQPVEDGDAFKIEYTVSAAE